MLKIGIHRGQDSNIKHLNVNLHNNIENLPKISDSTIDEWIQEGINWLHENKDEFFFAIQSGNTRVTVTRDKSNDAEGYKINVSTPRQYAYVRLED